MESFRGVVYEGAVVVADRAEGYYEVRSVGPRLEWEGMLTTEDARLRWARQGPLRLVLDDGRQGRITVRRLGSAPGGRISAHFVGLGPPP
jgi:hypothetical protein